MSDKLLCACGHWHGSFHCEANIGDEEEPFTCQCTRFRVGVRGGGSHRKVVNQGTGRNISSGGSAFLSPLYHMTAFSLKNPVVLECIERGWYVDIEDRAPENGDNLTAEGRRVANQLGIQLSYNPWASSRWGSPLR